VATAHPSAAPWTWDVPLRRSQHHPQIYTKAGDSQSPGERWTRRPLQSSGAGHSAASRCGWDPHAWVSVSIIAADNSHAGLRNIPRFPSTVHTRAAATWLSRSPRQLPLRLLPTRPGWAVLVWHSHPDQTSPAGEPVLRPPVTWDGG
jgi:hypothetical protein